MRGYRQPLSVPAGPDIGIKRAFGRLHRLRKIRLRIGGRSPDDSFELRIRVRQNGDVRGLGIAGLGHRALRKRDRQIGGMAPSAEMIPTANWLAIERRIQLSTVKANLQLIFPQS
jgi:hypothetical protein